MFYENETGPVIEAHFYPGSGSKPAIIAISARMYGERRFLREIPVLGKRDARKVAARHNATPWNF